MNKYVTNGAAFWEKTYCAAYDPPQGVPRPFIEPIEELIEAIGGEMVCWSVVEPVEMQKNNRDYFV